MKIPYLDNANLILLTRALIAAGFAPYDRYVGGSVGVRPIEPSPLAQSLLPPPKSVSYDPLGDFDTMLFYAGSISCFYNEAGVNVLVQVCDETTLCIYSPAFTSETIREAIDAVEFLDIPVKSVAEIQQAHDIFSGMAKLSPVDEATTRPILAVLCWLLRHTDSPNAAVLQASIDMVKQTATFEKLPDGNKSKRKGH